MQKESRQKKSTYGMIPLKYKSTKFKLLYNDKNISGRLRMMGEGARGTNYKRQKGTSRGDGYIQYFDHGDGFTGMYIC